MLGNFRSNWRGQIVDRLVLMVTHLCLGAQRNPGIVPHINRGVMVMLLRMMMLPLMLMLMAMSMVQPATNSLLPTTYYLLPTTCCLRSGVAGDAPQAFSIRPPPRCRVQTGIYTFGLELRSSSRGAPRMPPYPRGPFDAALSWGLLGLFLGRLGAPLGLPAVLLGLLGLF